MRKFVACLTVILLFAACAKPYPQRSPFEVSPVSVKQGEQRITDQVIVITDGSATMVQEANFPEARALTQTFIAAMPEAAVRSKGTETYQAALISFGGAERGGAPLADFNRELLADKAAYLRPLGSLTLLDQVLGEVQDELAGSSGRAAIVIFSDGLPTSEQKAIAAAQSLISNHNGEVCIHTVHTATDAAGGAFLSRLSSLTGCGSTRTGGSLAVASDMDGFQRQIFLGPAALPVVATPGPCESRIVLRGVQFEFDRSQLMSESGVVLDAAVDQLKQCPNVSLRVDGYTCSIGAEGYNDGLSERRADAVRSYLINAGVDSGRLETRAFGESNPVASNATEDGRVQNRRVELSPEQ